MARTYATLWVLLLIGFLAGCSQTAQPNMADDGNTPIRPPVSPISPNPPGPPPDKPEPPSLPGSDPNPRSGVPQETVDPQHEPLKWQRLQHPKLPKGDLLSVGPSMIRVLNPPVSTAPETVLAVLTRNKQAGWFFVDQGQTRQYPVPNGQYQMSFIFSNRPESLYQGEPIRVNHQLFSITLSQGNFRIKPVP